MRRALLGALVVVAAACGGNEPRTAEPVVDLISDAVAAIEAHYGAPQEYFEISAGLESIGVIVAVDGATAAEQSSFSAEAGLVGPEPVGEASGATFVGGDITFDPDRVFDRIRDELDDPVIVDFAIQGGPDGTVIYDVTVATTSGGVLLVLVAPDGTIQGAQAQ
ncbi:MAG: hypothetical protein ABIP17_08735 [Ilumatobacteraceae bacterium]